jgi:hypothetical protein
LDILLSLSENFYFCNKKTLKTNEHQTTFPKRLAVCKALQMARFADAYSDFCIFVGGSGQRRGFGQNR